LAGEKRTTMEQGHAVLVRIGACYDNTMKGWQASQK